MNWQYWTFTALHVGINILVTINHIKENKAGELFIQIAYTALIQALVTFSVLSALNQ